jgi:hypothetical protein
MSRTDTALERLERALTAYDQAKLEHAATTSALKDAKEHVDDCARYAVSAYRGTEQQPELPLDPPATDTVDAEVDGKPARVIRPAADGYPTFDGETGALIGAENKPKVTDISESGSAKKKK